MVRQVAVSIKDIFKICIYYSFFKKLGGLTLKYAHVILAMRNYDSTCWKLSFEV